MSSAFDYPIFFFVQDDHAREERFRDGKLYIKPFIKSTWLYKSFIWISIFPEAEIHLKREILFLNLWFMNFWSKSFRSSFTFRVTVIDEIKWEFYGITIERERLDLMFLLFNFVLYDFFFNITIAGMKSLT